MRWLHFIALTLFQPHGQLKPFLLFLIISEPLSWDATATGEQVLMEDCPSTTGSILRKREPHALAKDGKQLCHRSIVIELGVVSAVLTPSTESLTFEYSEHHKYPELYFHCPAALYGYSWPFMIGIFFMIHLFSPSFRRFFLVQSRNEKPEGKKQIRWIIPSAITISHHFHYHWA